VSPSLATNGPDLLSKVVDISPLTMLYFALLAPYTVISTKLASACALCASKRINRILSWHVLEDGVTSGDDIYLLAGQHPYLAILDPREVNAFLSPFRDSHVLPHKVRLNPLSLNTVNHKQEKRIRK